MRMNVYMKGKTELLSDNSEWFTWEFYIHESDLEFYKRLVPHIVALRKAGIDQLYTEIVEDAIEHAWPEFEEVKNKCMNRVEMAFHEIDRVGKEMVKVAEGGHDRFMYEFIRPATEVEKQRIETAIEEVRATPEDYERLFKELFK